MWKSDMLLCQNGRFWSALPDIQEQIDLRATQPLLELLVSLNNLPLASQGAAGGKQNMLCGINLEWSPGYLP
jgi:hypothetical protein